MIPCMEVEIELARSTEAEKQSQIDRLAAFKSRNAEHAGEALERLRCAAINNENVFEELMDATSVILRKALVADMPCSGI